MNKICSSAASPSRLNLSFYLQRKKRIAGDHRKVSVRSTISQPTMQDVPSSTRPNGHSARWKRRFADAMHGIATAARDQESLWIHFAFAVAVVVLCVFLQVDAWQWCVLAICVAIVISLELVNSAIERLVKTLHPEHDAGLAETLHMAAGAVLVAAIGSAVVGLIVFIPPFVRLFN